MYQCGEIGLIEQTHCSASSPIHMIQKKQIRAAYYLRVSTESQELENHDALQAKGIRCWLYEKQLLPGDDISRQLERGIHLWDKFLLCASKNSLTSWWVEKEIKSTLAKERALQEERGEPVLKLIL